MTRKKKGSLVELGAALHDLKARQADIAEQIDEKERAIIAHTGFAKDEGQQAFRDSDLSGQVEIVLKQPVNRKLLADVWAVNARAIPATLRRKLVVSKPTLVMGEVTALRRAAETDEKQAAVYALLAQAVESKPGKVNVSIKSIDLRERSAD